MSAPNFSYDRRCVLVTNDDFEFGNVPAHSIPFGNDRSYPSVVLDKYLDDFTTIAIVLTSGYYADACIDIVDREDKIRELVGYPDYYATYSREELVEEICYFLGCSRNFANKHLKGCRTTDINYARKLEKALDELVEAWRDAEVEKANKVVDKIMKDYGYKELTKVAQFSNGEAWYDYAK